MTSTTTPDGIDHYPHTEGGPDFRQTCYADGDPWPCAAVLGLDGETGAEPPKATPAAPRKRSRPSRAKGPQAAQDAPSAPTAPKAD